MSLKISQQVIGTIKVVDRMGNDAGASLDAPPLWSTDAALLKLDVAPDGLSGTLVPVGPLGSARVQVDGVSGGKPLTGSVIVDLTAGEAVSLTIELGTPTDKP